jgi:hypothetical protein
VTEWRTDEQTGIEIPVRRKSPASKIANYDKKASAAAQAINLVLVHVTDNPIIAGAINIHDAWTIAEEPNLFVPVAWHDGQKSDCRAGLLTITEGT